MGVEYTVNVWLVSYVRRTLVMNHYVIAFGPIVRFINCECCFGAGVRAQYNGDFTVNAFFESLFQQFCLLGVVVTASTSDQQDFQFLVAVFLSGSTRHKADCDNSKQTAGNGSQSVGNWGLQGGH